MTLQYISSVIDLVMKVAFMIFIFVKWDDVRTILCESGSANMSSKRVIAIACTYTLCTLCIAVTHPEKPIDPYILLTLAVMTLLASAIATWAQITSGLDKIKSLIPSNVAKEVKQSVIKNTTEETKEIKVETTTNTQQKEE